MEGTGEEEVTEAKFVDLELKVHVTYSPNGVDEKTLADNLEQSVIQAVGNGLLTSDDSAAEVDTWTLEISKAAPLPQMGKPHSHGRKEVNHANKK